MSNILLSKPSRRRKIISRSDKINENKLISVTPENPMFAKIVGPNPEKSALRHLRGDLTDTYNSNSENKLVNISSLLISDEIYGIVSRFNLCECDECLNGIYLEALAAMPASFVSVSSLRNPENKKSMEEKMEELRPTAIKILTKICISQRTS
ncbi:MAG: hypothetical protein LBR74_09825 [Eubacterium sp.]|jgi:hypothetical protein|nr:hypothetical protein [Eubacterium sp.]